VTSTVLLVAAAALPMMPTPLLTEPALVMISAL